MLNRLIIIALVILVTLTYSLYKKKNLETQLSDGMGEAAILSKLPDAVFKTLDGEEVKLQELYRKQDVSLLVVHFWGTWCAPCEAELPELLSFIKRFEGRTSVKFLLVAVSDDVNKVRKHIKTLPTTNAAWLLDNADAYRGLFGTTRVPETFVFSSDMATLRKFVGPQEWNKELFFQTFDEFLQISTRKL